MTPALRSAGGTIYDPANGIDGVIKDLYIADGRIVAEADLPDGARTIDASGTIVMPGGVDVHTHVAGGALNFARGLVPENQRAARKFLHGIDRRAGRGGMTPTTFATGYLYAGMGWTTGNEAAVPVLSARHTHEELHDIPIVDKTDVAPMAYTDLDLALLTRGSCRGWSGRPGPTGSRRSTPAASRRGSGARTRTRSTRQSKDTRASRRRRSFPASPPFPLIRSAPPPCTGT